MTNATKTLAIIFAVTSVIALVLHWSSGAQASRAFKSNLVEVDTASVDKMVINHPTKPTLTLTKTNQQWSVSGQSATSYMADKGQIMSAIARLNNLSVNAVATRNPEKYTRYKVDSTGINVALYQENQKLNSIFVGASQRAGRRSLNNYVRLENENAVYTVDGFLRSTFSRDMTSWREKQVWDLDQQNISKVTFTYPADSSYVINRTVNNKWVASGDTLSGSSVGSVLRDLSDLTADGFANSRSVDQFGNEKYVLQLQLKDGKQYRLQIKESPDNNDEYLAVSKGFPYVFTLQKSQWKDNVLKSRSDLLQN